jgi:chromosome segregation ATPase
MNKSFSKDNLLAAKLQSEIPVSELRNIELNPSRQTFNWYDSNEQGRTSKDGYYFFDVLKPPSLRHQVSPIKQQINKHVDNPGLHDLQAENEQLKEELGMMREKNKELRGNAVENETSYHDAEIELQEFESRAKTAQAENHTLKAEVRKLQERNHQCEGLVHNLENIETDARMTKDESVKLKAKISELEERNHQCEELVCNLTRKMDKALRSNRLLIERGTEMDETLTETQKRWMETKKEYEKLSRWVDTHKISLEDYEEAMKISNSLSKEFPIETNMLTRRIKDLSNYKKGRPIFNKDLQLKVVELSKELHETRLQLDTATQKYTFDREKSKTQIEFLSGKEQASEEMVILT